MLALQKASDFSGVGPKPYIFKIFPQRTSQMKEGRNHLALTVPALHFMYMFWAFAIFKPHIIIPKLYHYLTRNDIHKAEVSVQGFLLNNPH